jgi:peptide/nickel transport system substrate-binding protein
MESTTAYSQLDKGGLTMLFYDWIGDYPDAENFLMPLLSCSKAEGNRCLEGNSVLGGTFWTAPGLEAELQRSSQLDVPERIALLVAIQRRVAAASPYLPVWLSAPAAWGRPGVSRPRFDGSGRVVLGELRRLSAAPAGRAP